ncbi:MAG: outer membrane beta-barrel protein, partial [Gammaproteobacteria bacterium]|nr:outer membrane beta-barrel protein [Gammaproteobacteria bacterium]
MKHVFFILPICLLAISSNHVIAADFANGFYFGGNGGLADNSSVCEEIGSPVSPRNCEDQGFGWQIFAGWQFFKWIGIEGGWTNLGQTSHLEVTGTTLQSETEGLQVNVVATVPGLEKIGLYFKAGAFLWDLEVSQTDNLGNRQEISDKDVDYVLGA